MGITRYYATIYIKKLFIQNATISLFYYWARQGEAEAKAKAEALERHGKQLKMFANFQTRKKQIDATYVIVSSYKVFPIILVSPHLLIVVF